MFSGKHFFGIVALIVLISIIQTGAVADKGEETVIKLPRPEIKGKISLEETIAKRRSVRSYRGMPLSDKELSQLLWAAQGITAAAGGLRAAPSAGATYPLETYVVSASGVFHYRPQGHLLKRIAKDDQRSALVSAALGQRFLRKASVVIVFAAVAKRTTGRYGKRGEMYIHMEAGHAAQNVHLQAVALGMGSVPVGAFDEQAVAGALKLPADQTPLYLIGVGR